MLDDIQIPLVQFCSCLLLVEHVSSIGKALGQIPKRTEGNKRDKRLCMNQKELVSQKCFDFKFYFQWVKQEAMHWLISRIVYVLPNMWPQAHSL